MVTVAEAGWALRRSASHLLLCGLSATAAVVVLVLAVAAELLMVVVPQPEPPFLPTAVRWPMLAVAAALLHVGACALVIRLCGWLYPSRSGERALRVGVSSLLAGVLGLAVAAVVQLTFVRWMGWLERTGGHGYLVLLWFKFAAVFCLAIAWVGAYSGAFLARTKAAVPGKGATIAEGAG